MEPNQQTLIPTPIHHITALILAGGQGSRMGGLDKGLLDFKGRPLVEYLIQALQAQSGQILINANRNLSSYATYGFPLINDELENFQGPLAGIAAALQATRTPCLLTIPCDSPFVATDMAERLYQTMQSQQAELAVAHDGERLHPIHALIPIRLLGSLHRYLASGERKVEKWYRQHQMAQVDFSDKAHLFRNINTLEQKQQLEREE